RTMWGIVYSCLLVMFACIWTVVHPDLPKLGRDGIQPLKLHIGLMVVPLVFPEDIALRGTNSCWLAEFQKNTRWLKVCPEFDNTWTLTHPYFVVMDGFFDSSEGRSVYLNDLQRYPENTGDTRKAAITRNEILDRSKGDGFPKFLIVLQLCTMVYHSIFRTI
ncbi:uncharacterized protein EI90DRAFT_2881161, partial [Cantharellus anzutake]|uniref:uncharacterized protein n=1 Tax=Cantharellus anzutake TaxID=1750568 RepID=UPI00190389CE